MYGYLDQVGKVLDADPNIVDAMVQMPSQNGAAGSNQGILRVIPLAKHRKLSADQIVAGVELQTPIRTEAGFFRLAPPHGFATV